MPPRVFNCWRCSRRLNVDDDEGRIHVTVYCPKCKAANRLNDEPTGANQSFRDRVKTKAG